MDTATVLAGAGPATPPRRVAPHPLRAVLFDLDGTLLDIDGEGFLDAYVDLVVEAWAPQDADAFRAQLMAASVAFFRSDGGRTNGEAFRTALAGFLEQTPEAIADRLADIHRTALPRVALRGRPVEGARACVQGCLRLGLQVAVATTPIYMPEVIALRLRWAGLDDLPWDLVTHSENMHTCKPDPAYFQEAAAQLTTPPASCLMVGDDPMQDGPARRAGMLAVIGEPGVPARRLLAQAEAAVAASRPA